ncbi:MAG: response regulator [Sandaracinaceae bacterium]|nr:response regulator [Sandaracinaceae bacterium]
MEGEPRPRLLLVDDGVDVLDMLAVLLREEGFEVATANDGLAALEACRARVPDLMLLDLNMPGLDGFQVLARLKADERLRDTSVVVISGSPSDSDVVRALELGATDYLTKPYAFPILLARVRAVLRSRREKAAIWRLGEDLRAAQDELARTRRSAAIGAIAAGLSHSINNPAAFVVADLHEIRELAAELLDAGDDARGEVLEGLADEALDGMDRIRDAVRDLSVLTEVLGRRSIPSEGALELAEIVRRRVERSDGRVTLRDGDEPAWVAPGLGGQDELDALIGLLLREAGSAPATVTLERGESLITLRVGSSETPEASLTLAIAQELAERFGGTLEQGFGGSVLRLPRGRAS